MRGSRLRIRDADPVVPNGDAADAYRWLVGRVLSPLLGLLGGVTALSWILVSVLHLRDRYNTTHVSGAWMALAAHANAGTLYPELYDGQRYGGTRFMPGFVVLHAAMARVTGEYLTSGKLVALACAVVLLAAIFATLRRLGCSTLVALGLTSLVLVTGTGLWTTTSIRGDALAVAWQLGAVALAERTTKRGGLVGAAALCTLAVLTKLSALWAAIAIGLWLLIYHRRQFLMFAGSFVGLLVASLAGLHLATTGRMAASFMELTFAGLEGHKTLAKATLGFLGLFQQFASVTWALFGFALLAMAVGIMHKQVSIYQLSLVTAVIIVAVEMADYGTYQNHLLDLVVLTVVVIGGLWAQATSSTSSLWPLAAAIAIAVVWIGGSSYLLNLRIETMNALQGDRAAHSIGGLLEQLPQGATLLSEDPSIPLAQGQLPMVLDPWMVSRLEVRHPEWVGDLATRIDQKEFDVIVLLYRADEAHEGWYESQFGNTVISAVRRHYRWTEQIAGYQLYLPAPTPP
jgi:hypothetical protein